MPLEEILLLLLTLVVMLGAPIYILFREKMQKGGHEHTRKRVIKLTTVNLALNLTAALYFSTFLFLILKKTNLINFPFLPAEVLIYLLIICITFYGNGIYITSILLEDFTLPDLRTIKSFKTQFIATHLFHGPISHVLIYSGWMVVFFILTLIEMSLKLPISNSDVLLLGISGAILGVFYSIAQIYNGTAIYQFITGAALSIILIIIGLLNKTNFGGAFITSYFLAFIITFEAFTGAYLIILFILKVIEKEPVVWDNSGGLEQIKKEKKFIDKLLQR